MMDFGIWFYSNNLIDIRFMGTVGVSKVKKNENNDAVNIKAF